MEGDDSRIFMRHVLPSEFHSDEETRQLPRARMFAGNMLKAARLSFRQFPGVTLSQGISIRHRQHTGIKAGAAGFGIEVGKETHAQRTRKYDGRFVKEMKYNCI